MSFLEHIGNTPLLVVEDIYVKLECANPGGSIKDRIAKFMLEEAAARGELKAGDTLVEATSGNTGIALSLAARAMDYGVIIFMPEHMSVERRQLMESLGAEVRLTPREESFEGAVKYREEFRGKPGYFIPDQFGNPDNTRCHRETTGQELLRQLEEKGCEELHCFVAGTGTGGTLMGVGEALKSSSPQLRLVAVEPTESAVMSGEEAGEHGIMGIGDGFIPDLVDMGCVDEVICVSTEDAHAAAGTIHDHHGYCVGRSAGANMIAARQLRDRGLTVATVWPDSSDRYVSVGLKPPSSNDVRCPLQSACAKRWSELLDD